MRAIWSVERGLARGLSEDHPPYKQTQNDWRIDGGEGKKEIHEDEQPKHDRSRSIHGR